jgi:hypothetical protein
LKHVFLNCTGDIVSCAQYVTRVHRCITGELVLRAKLSRVLNRKFNLGKWGKILEVDIFVCSLFNNDFSVTETRVA